MTGDVTVGIVDKIPVEGVHMLLGNDIAGGQVNMCPVLCEKPVLDETCTLSVGESQLHPEYVVTRAMTRASHYSLTLSRQVIIILLGLTSCRFPSSLHSVCLVKSSAHLSWERYGGGGVGLLICRWGSYPSNLVYTLL